MKTSLVIVLISLILVGGCSLSPKHTRESSLNTAENGRVSFSGETSTIFNRDPGPEELARAALIVKMSEAYAKGESVKAEGWYTIGFRNNSLKDSLFVPNPELPGSTIEIEPRGGFGFLQLMNLPSSILIYDQRWKLKEKLSLRRDLLKEKKVVNGLEVDVLITYSD